MATITDLIDEASIDVTTEGLRATRAFLVSGLTGDAHAITFQAYFAEGIPVQGEAHPSVTGLVVETMSARPVSDSPGSARITVNYKPRNATRIASEGTAPPVISTGATVQEDETNFDANGNVIRLAYTSNPDANGNVKYNGTVATGKIRRAFPMPVIKFARRESVNPFAKVLTYTQKVNATPFYGFDEKTWLLSNIESDSSDGGLTWNVTYELQYNPKGWRTAVVFTDKETGEIPDNPEPSEGNGLLVVDAYETIDFAPLNLEIPL